MRARKRFAQHFLEAAWVNKLVARSRPTPDDSILEIGPGKGAITRPLASQVRRLLAIEIDRDLAADSKRAALPKVSVVTSDVLSVDLKPIIAEWLGAPPGPSESDPDRRQPSLQHLVADPVCAARPRSATNGVPGRAC